MPLEEYISNAGVHTRGEDVSSLIDIMCPHIARAVIPSPSSVIRVGSPVILVKAGIYRSASGAYS